MRTYPTTAEFDAELQKVLQVVFWDDFVLSPKTRIDKIDDKGQQYCSIWIQSKKDPGIEYHQEGMIDYNNNDQESLESRIAYFLTPIKTILINK